MQPLTGLATGIGSLPFTDAEQALDLIFSCCPRIPFWPQLPKRGVRESMVAQFSENLPCLKLTPEGVRFDPSDRDGEMERFYERLIAEDTDYFAISPEYAPGLEAFLKRLESRDLADVAAIKFHVTGPFTFAGSINDEKGMPLLHDPVMMQAYLKGLVMKAAWQVKKFRRFGRKMILFIDEPFLATFGSAYAAVNREDVLGALGDFCSGVCGGDDLEIGIHCCGNTDWSLFTGIPGLSIINFDAFDFLDRVVLYGSELKGFLEREGYLCWGIVPTNAAEIKPALTARDLRGKIDGGIKLLAARGIDSASLKERILVSPACGLGNQDPGGARMALELLKEVSEGLRGGQG